MDSRFFFYFVGAALLPAMMLTSAHAQGKTEANVPPPGSTLAARPVGVSVVAAPPADFNPLTASSEANAHYAIPPAPDPRIAPRAYNEWRKAVTGPQKRVAPVLTQTDISNGPMQKAGPSVPHANASNVVNTLSFNWSGTSVVNSLNPFKVEAIIGEFVVPTAHQAFGACTGGWDYSSQWPGIDGNGVSELLQAGVEVDAYCNGGATASRYYAWVEWVPNNATRVSSPAIHRGDLVFVEVWNTSPTSGHAFFKNFSTLETAIYDLIAPPLAQLVGNSVEWIVERPSIGGVPQTLTNYIEVPLPLGVAWNYTAGSPTVYFEGLDPLRPVRSN